MGLVAALASMLPPDAEVIGGPFCAVVLVDGSSVTVSWDDGDWLAEGWSPTGWFGGGGGDLAAALEVARDLLAYLAAVGRRRATFGSA